MTTTAWTPPPGAVAEVAGQTDTRPVLAGSFVSERLDLPSGGWVEFHDPKDLKGRDYKRVMRGLKNTDAGAATVDLLDGLIAVMVARWDIPYLPGAPLPCDDIAMTDELTIADLSAIQVAVRPAMHLILPTQTGTGPGTPTQPASV